ncbi:MAG: RNA polymerase sigma factor [Bacillota bacterium]
MRNKYETAFFYSYISIHQKNIERFISSYVKTNDDALDLVQNTLECAWKKMHQLKDHERAKSWLFSIAYNEIKKYYRKKKVENSMFSVMSDDNDIERIDDKSGDFVELFNKKEDYQRLHTAIKKLDEKSRHLIWLRYIEELSIKEIAEILEINYNSTRVYVSRAKQKLKEVYQSL